MDDEERNWTHSNRSPELLRGPKKMNQVASFIEILINKFSDYQIYKFS